MFVLFNQEEITKFKRLQSTELPGLTPNVGSPLARQSNAGLNSSESQENEDISPSATVNAVDLSFNKSTLYASTSKFFL